MNKTITPMPQYAEYKDSGIGWMGQIPAHWEVKKLKHIFFEKKHKGNMALNCGSISFGKVVRKDDDKIPHATKASYQEVLEGEFLINPLNLNYDLISLRIALSKLDIVVSAGYIVLRTQIETNKEYYKYLLYRYDVAFMKLLGSGVRQTISFNHIADSILITPPLSEQTAIADFLDDKTAKIEALVGIKRRQIELLVERKQILIQNAVTKGLNPDAPMKDSGVDWIGPIPAGWEVKRLASFGRFSKGGGFSKSDLADSGTDAVLYGDIYTQYDFVIDGAVRKISTKVADKSVWITQGDLLFTGSGETKEDIGKCVLYCGSTKAVAGGDVILFRQTESHSLFLSFCLNTNGIVEQKAKSSKGEIIVHTYASKLREIFIPIPPLSEQTAIADFLDDKTAKIDDATAIKQNQIKKLNEYKTTLINAAVTGKIKVTA